LAKFSLIQDTVTAKRPTGYSMEQYVRYTVPATLDTKIDGFRTQLPYLVGSPFPVFKIFS